MAILVKIESADGSTTENIEVSDRAREFVALDFNPSNDKNIYRMKVLIAAFVSECNRFGSINSTVNRLTQAVDHAEIAAMLAVKTLAHEVHDMKE